MEVTRDRVVRFHYEMFDGSGKRIETTRGGEPVAVLYGHGELVPGLERALAGRGAGDRFEVRLTPADAFGERREGRARRIQKKHLRHPRRVRAGQIVDLRTDQGVVQAVVTKVGSSVVDVDLNHPLAGRSLAFQIEVIEVREAEPEEIAHGHVHGPGGHGHG